MNAPRENDEGNTVKLEVSDSEFRAETIYFVVLDRFHQGNRKQGIKPTALDDPSRQDWGKYWGGDLQGVIDKLDYLKEIGVTAVWVTPLFEQIEALTGDRAAIHGYWTKDFKRLNSRWVNTPDEVKLFHAKHTIFDELLEQLHSRGMKFILDIVCNHSSPETPEGKGRLFDDGKLIADFHNDKKGWYYHYGEVKDWDDEWQVQHCEFEGVAKFNENNLEFRRYITQAIRQWLERGVDALRIDTIKHMPIWFWQEVTAEWQSQNPSLFCFGEWNQSHPDNDKSVQYANHAGMSILDFALCQAIREALGEQHPKGFKRVQEVLARDCVYHCPTELVTFFENHDMPRLLSIGGTRESLALATILILTGRGIPCLYYGSEQYLHNDKEGGDDPYNRPMMEKWESTEMTRVISLLSRERKQNCAIQWGEHAELHVSADVYIFLRRYREYRCLVALNKGSDTTLSGVQVDLPDGKHECVLSGEKIEVRAGQANFTLAKNQAIVLSRLGKPITGKSVAHLRVTGVSTTPGQTVAIIGDCEELGGWDVHRAIKLEYVNPSTWFGEIPFSTSAGTTVAYKFVILPAADDELPVREMRTVRRRPIACEGIAKWRDNWES